MSEQPLPGMPDPGASPPNPSPAGARVVRSDGRRLCEECCRQIHVMGIIRAPYPNTARWRITTSDAVLFLCHNHKQEWLSR